MKKYQKCKETVIAIKKGIVQIIRLEKRTKLHILDTDVFEDTPNFVVCTCNKVKKEHYHHIYSC